MAPDTTAQTPHEGLRACSVSSLPPPPPYAKDAALPSRSKVPPPPSVADLPPPGPSLTRSSTSFSRVQRHLRVFRSSTASSKSGSDRVDEDDAHGPCGLNLVSEPSEPRLDFIFVHGLGGGSKKTWSAKSAPGTFWPKEWLPSEPGFKHVRIHSYGYNSDWSKTQQSHLGIHDFGQALLADLYNSPALRKNGNTPIVLVAHSMGGLVIKKAYLLARRDPIYQAFARRIRSMYFLCTPHRGADSAQTLSRILASSFFHGSKAYLDELAPNSSLLQIINDEFRHVSTDLQLWSFFEGVPTTSGPRSFIVVEKESAVMGLPEEHVQYLEADHRQVCKFDNPEHPNYRIVQRCLLRAVEDLEGEYLRRRQDSFRSEMKAIAAFLGVEGRPEADLLNVTEKQQPGTCSWLTEHSSFNTWLSGSPHGETATSGAKSGERPTPRFLWLHGAPGSGKSISSGHVIRFLEDCNFDCGYYFFKHGNTETSTPAALLRSLAFQLAWLNFDIRKAVLAMVSNVERFNPNDHNLIWNRVFIGSILKTVFTSPQFWVIDALDECASNSLNVLLHMLAKIPQAVPLRVFLTSRPSVQVQQALGTQGSPVLELEAGGEGSKLDIAKFLRSRRPYSSGSDLSDEIVSEILAKSHGIFLWASLVMEKLDKTYAEEDMEQVLQDVPTEMNDFYNRIAKAISETPNMELAKCILKWTVCAARPLSVNELREAIRLDINRTLAATTPNDRLAHLCGDLITVDRQSRVHVIHQTVRSFLLQRDSAFKINQGDAHARLAEVCLGYLTGKEFAPPRGRRKPSSVTKSHGSDLALAEYACAHFPFHLAHCSPNADAPLQLLHTFLSSNVLTWVDHVSRKGSLVTLVRSVQSLRSFLSRRAKHRPLLDKHSGPAAAWVSDLAHIAGSFGSNLIDLPACVYAMIPALSPPQSMIHQAFAKESLQCKLLGVPPDRIWDDRISCLVYENKAMTVSASEQHLAIGLSNGTVMLYDSTTLQLVGTLTHGESVRNLAFGPGTGSLVATSVRKISLWNSDGECQWVTNLSPSRSPLSIVFSVDEEQLLVPARDGELHIISVKDGSDLDELPLASDNDSESEGDDGGRQYLLGTPPALVRVSPVHGLAAVTYRSAPVIIWDVERRQKAGVFYRTGTKGNYLHSQIHDMAFNPLADADLLAVAYDSIGVVLCDPWSQEQHALVKIEACTLASSPDGRTLVVGDDTGMIHMLSFEASPRVLYRIASLNTMLRALSFSVDGLRVFEARDNFCNAWEPPALVRRETFDDNSSESLSTGTGAASSVSEMVARPINHADHITCLAAADEGEQNVVFCGRRDGTISVHDAAQGTRLHTFRAHPGEADGYAITLLEWHAGRSVLVAANDVNSCVAVRLAVTTTEQGTVCYAVEHPPLFTRSAVRYAVIHASGELFHVSTLEGDEVWNAAGEMVGRYECIEHGVKRRWMQHPTDDNLLLLFKDQRFHVFRWENLEELTPPAGFPLALSSEACAACASPAGEWSSRKGSNLLVRTRRSDKDHTCFEFLDVSELDPSAVEDAVPVACLSKALLAHPKAVIGQNKSLLYFVDLKGWVSSVTLKDLHRSGEYTRHFFIPRRWMVGETLLLRLVCRGHSVAMAHRDDLLVFQGFLVMEEKIAFLMEGALVRRFTESWS